MKSVSYFYSNTHPSYFTLDARRLCFLFAWNADIPGKRERLRRCGWRFRGSCWQQKPAGAHGSQEGINKSESISVSRNACLSPMLNSEKFFSDVSCRGNAIGMENKKISGGGILASSWHSPYVDFLPDQGRLNNQKGSWCPKSEDDDKNPYLQVRE